MRGRLWVATGAAGTSGAVAAILASRRARLAREGERLRREMTAALVPPGQLHSTVSQIVKPTPRELLVDRGTGTMYETRLSSLDGFLVPADRFFVRSQGATPRIDLREWRLAIEGSGVKHAVVLDHDELRSMRQVTIDRAIACAGNERRFFKEAFGVEAEGTQWRTGAMGVASWTGVRLRDVLARAGIRPGARDVMPEGLDANRVRRPMPLAKALADDTLLALQMNGEPLPPDHGFPARVIVSGWAGIASIKWVGRIEVSMEPLHSPWNTHDYVLIGPAYRPRWPALGEVITEMPVTSFADLDWPARLPAGRHLIHGRAFAGEGCVREVVARFDGEPWRRAELFGPDGPGAWRRWRITWDARPGQHELRMRATDDRGRTQPDRATWNHHGYLYDAVIAHPIEVQTTS